jgi:hypothetical protein
MGSVWADLEVWKNCCREGWFFVGSIKNQIYSCIHRAFWVFTLPKMVCEACGKAQARYGDILCSDCAYYYSILRELIDEHPELAVNEIDRLKELFQWREKKTQLTPHRLAIA